MLLNATRKFFAGVVKGLKSPESDNERLKRSASEDTVEQELLQERPGKRRKIEQTDGNTYAIGTDPLLSLVTQNLLAAPIENDRTRLASEPLPASSASVRKKSRFVEHFDTLKKSDQAKIAQLEAQVDHLQKELGSKHVHFAATPQSSRMSFSSDWTPVNRPAAPFPPPPSSISKPSTGKPLNNWEEAIQGARAKLRETPSPVPEASTRKTWAARKSALSHVPSAATDKFLSEVKTIKLRKVAKTQAKRESTADAATRSRINFSLRKKSSHHSLASTSGMETAPIEEWHNTTFTFVSPSPVAALLANKVQQRPHAVSYGRAVSTNSTSPPKGSPRIAIISATSPILPEFNFGRAITGSPSLARAVSAGKHSIIPGAYEGLPKLAAKTTEEETEKSLPQIPSADVSSVPFPKLPTLPSSPILGPVLDQQESIPFPILEDTPCSPERSTVIHPIPAGLPCEDSMDMDEATLPLPLPVVEPIAVGLGNRKRSSKILKPEVSKPLTARQQTLKRKRLSESSVSSLEQEKENEGSSKAVDIKVEETELSANGAKEKLADRVVGYGLSPLLDAQGR